MINKIKKLMSGIFVASSILGSTYILNHYDIINAEPIFDTIKVTASGIGWASIGTVVGIIVAKIVAQFLLDLLQDKNSVIKESTETKINSDIITQGQNAQIILQNELLIKYEQTRKQLELEKNKILAELSLTPDAIKEKLLDQVNKYTEAIEEPTFIENILDKGVEAIEDLADNTINNIFKVK